MARRGACTSRGRLHAQRGQQAQSTSMNRTAPELLLPAGSLAHLRTAFDFGADAVYAGQPRYSLRARNNEFRLEQIAQGIAEAHARGKRFFVTSNLIAHNDKVRTYLRDLAPVVELRPDALIMADAGLIMLVREEMERGRWPEVPIHLSVQANTTNWAAVKFWQRAGVSRIILSRELSLEEIAQIRDACPDVELEVFVHGALCIAYSGRCLLSGYFNRRDPNQGTCTNACRWSYRTHAADESDTGDVQPRPATGCGSGCGEGLAGEGEPALGRLGPDFDFAHEQAQAEATRATTGDGRRHPLADRVWLLEERQRPGELMPIMEDEHGTLHPQQPRSAGGGICPGFGAHRRRFAQDRRAHQKRVLRGSRRPGVPPRDRRRGGGPALRSHAAASARWPGQPRLHQRLAGAPPRAGVPKLRPGPLRPHAQPVRG